VVLFASHWEQPFADATDAPQDVVSGVEAVAAGESSRSSVCCLSPAAGEEAGNEPNTLGSIEAADPANPRVLTDSDRRVLIGPDASVAEVFRRFGGHYLDDCYPGNFHKVWDTDRVWVMRQLALCRTRACGTVRWHCPHCGHDHTSYNACRNRHCPRCANHLEQEWLDRHTNDLLKVAYFHVVLTVPHEVNVLLGGNGRLGGERNDNDKVVYRCVFHATRTALLDAVRYDSSLHAQAGLLTVLHTWNQKIERHLHTHTLLPAAGWAVEDPRRLVTTDREDWLSMEAVMPRFRAALLEELTLARQQGELTFAGPSASLADDRRWAAWSGGLARRKWVVYSKPPVLPAQMTLEYLARYAHRIALGNARVRRIDLDQRTVTFTYRDNHSTRNTWGGYEELTIDAFEFIERFTAHVMPRGMSRVRKFGWWAGRNKKASLARMRVALNMPSLPKEEATRDPDGQEEEKAEPKPEPEPERLVIPCQRCGKRTLELVHRDYPVSKARLLEYQWTEWPARPVSPGSRGCGPPLLRAWDDDDDDATAYRQPREFP